MNKASIKACIGLGVIVVVIVVCLLAYGGDKSETTSVGNQTNSEMLTVEPKYAVVSEEVNYYRTADGYLARPEESGEYPALIIIHEWWGLN